MEPDKIDKGLRALINQITQDEDDIISYGCSNPMVEDETLMCDGYCRMCPHGFPIYKNR